MMCHQQTVHSINHIKLMSLTTNNILRYRIKRQTTTRRHILKC